MDGVLQEYRVFKSDGLLHVPKHLSYEEAACWPCAGVTAWNALYNGNPLVPGQTVLFQGTGGVSMAGLLFAVRAGAKVSVSRLNFSSSFVSVIGMQRLMWVVLVDNHHVRLR